MRRSISFETQMAVTLYYLSVEGRYTKVTNAFGISRSFPELSLRVHGQESEHPFSVNAYQSEFSKIDESGNIYEFGTTSSSVNLVSEMTTTMATTTAQNYRKIG